ncbi:hypothetical protein [Ekhidna sp.]
MTKYLRSIAYLSFIILFWCTIKLYAPENFESQRFKSTIEGLNNKSVVFVGSSRFRRGISDKELAARIPNRQFVNLGVFRNTMLPNFILSEFLIDSTEVELIFFELSLLNFEFTSSQMDLIRSLELSIPNSLNLISSGNSLEDLRTTVSIHNDLLLSKLIIKNQINAILGKKNTQPLFGYLPSKDNDVADESSFLKLEELTSTPGQKIDLHSYRILLNTLIRKADARNKKIVFMIPSTSRRPAEKDVIIPLFNSISRENKLIVDSLFFQRITKAEYLMDRNHFNLEGAIVHTNELARLILDQKFIELPSP